MRCDPEMLRAHKRDFTFFPGYVPPVILSVSQSDMIKRIEFLEELGIKKEIASLDYQYKLSKKRAEDMIKYEIEAAVSFLLDHEEFHDCLIDD